MELITDQSSLFPVSVYSLLRQVRKLQDFLGKTSLGIS